MRKIVKEYLKSLNFLEKLFLKTQPILQDMVYIGAKLKLAA